MNRTTRRDFLKTALAGTGALVTAPAWATAPSALPTVGSANHQVLLGSTGIKASFLAQGTGYNGFGRKSHHTLKGKKGFERLLHHSLDHGVNFIDMADAYGSHPFVRDAVKKVNRDRYVLLSKIWTRANDWVQPSGGARREFDRFRKELEVDMIDICLVHCAVNDRWAEEDKRVRDELSELKQQGAVRAVGVSCHDFGALKVAAEHPWVDVIFARINNMGGRQYVMDGTVEEVSAVLKTARANGKAVVGMKIFGAGKLTRPEQRDASLRYVIENNLVDAMTIGMLETSEVDDSIARIGKAFKA
jgi:predicted aldo/keto reductase-like oxidoreductase